MTTRAEKRKQFRAAFLIEGRLISDDDLHHLMFEYGGNTLCGLRAWSLADSAKDRESCADCDARLAKWMAVRGQSA